MNPGMKGVALAFLLILSVSMFSLYSGQAFDQPIKFAGWKLNCIDGFQFNRHPAAVVHLGRVVAHSIFHAAVVAVALLECHFLRLYRKSLSSRKVSRPAHASTAQIGTAMNNAFGVTVTASAKISVQKISSASSPRNHARSARRLTLWQYEQIWRRSCVGRQKCPSHSTHVRRVANVGSVFMRAAPAVPTHAVAPPFCLLPCRPPANYFRRSLQY